MNGHPVTPRTVAELIALTGVALGPTPWHEVTQEVINDFADTTGDHQWIHVDVERAKRDEFGSTLAHGLYTLSLGPAMLGQLLSFERFSASLNYGYDKVRFPAPLPVGSRVRMHAWILRVTEHDRGVRVHNQQLFEREGHTRPVAVAESIAHLTLASADACDGARC